MLMLLCNFQPENKHCSHNESRKIFSCNRSAKQRRLNALKSIVRVNLAAAAAASCHVRCFSLRVLCVRVAALGRVQM